ncbi:unnamed protein product [Dibothriocephalus latus]|uniref:Niemann-Pick C1 N-terminal domain-containing protein n=1 Tax=Dibothriocephalus latus TaxID=60516 RepID=A0A3P7LGS2_DIBLA|nr:unnamed protein product [Dibothriocephalus latus]
MESGLAGPHLSVKRNLESLENDKKYHRNNVDKSYTMLMRLAYLVLACFLPLTFCDQCIWYGVCPTPDSEGTYCAKNVSATPLKDGPDKTLQALLELCPDYASPDSSTESAPVCCDADQVKAFSVGIQSASVLLGRYVVLIICYCCCSLTVTALKLMH